MRLRSRVGWAVAASLGVHALVVAVAVLMMRHAVGPDAPTPPRFDTRVTVGAEPAREESPPVQVVAAPDPEPPAPVGPPTVSEAQDPPVATGGLSGSSTPHIVSVPPALPDTVLAHLRRFTHTPSPIVDPAVRPAAAVSAVRPAHGALAAGQRVVYLLDASGSMGEWGKFAASRDVLTATAAVQPASVDVKVVVYAATAEVVTPAALAARTPVGRGDHLAGLRFALAQAPDIVVWFTDADELPTAAVRTLLRRAGKPVTLFVARVGPNGVAAPAEFR
ncbi:MAG TPA: vWA domain-containing protein [Urbifossiella sp.]|nr:vWA domain-containing protein [Urbifossiella sp.]